MRLKQLEVVGLKSFANKTTLDFHSGVTAIVGPNGCGKSNVVDAIRWVLGEQSAKHLRGESMEDVIFKGNGRVGPAGMAEVSLTFENVALESRADIVDEDLDVSTLPAHFRNLSEITVSRRYFRSGESEYAINRTPCRLRDITELFLGTGIGSKAYAIIEQGRVEQLINAKSEDRRLFIEEAGGTTLYRSRRLAAERKIERTRENLLRVNDVSREIERQIQYLNRLAKKAERYRQLRDESREADLRLARHRWRQLQLADEQGRSELVRMRGEEERLKAELLQLDAQRDQCATTLRAAEEALASLREAAAVSVAERDSAEERVQLLRTEAQDRERRQTRLTETRDSLQLRCQEIEAELATARAEAESLTHSLDEERSQFAGEEERLHQARRSVATARGEVDLAKGKLVSTLAAESDARNEQARFERLYDEAERRRRKAEADCQHIGEQLSAAEHAVAGREVVLQRLAAAALRFRDTRTSLVAELDRVGKRLAEAQGALRAKREHALRLKSTLESLREIHGAYEGYSPVVRSLLLDTASGSGVEAVVGDVIQAPEEFERALAAILGDRINYMIVRSVRDGLAAAQTLRSGKDGRGSFVPQELASQAQTPTAAVPASGRIRPMLDVVRVSAAARDVARLLLGHVFLVADLETAAVVAAQVGPGIVMVTPEGDVFDSTGIVTAGSQDSGEEEILSRKRRLGEAAEQAALLEEAVSVAGREVDELDAQNSELSRQLQALDLELRRSTVESESANRDLAKLNLDLPRYRDRLRLTRFERETARRDAAAALAGAERLVERLSELASAKARMQAVLDEATTLLAADETSIEELVARVRASSAALAARQQQAATAQTVVARLGAEWKVLSSRLEGIAEELVEIARERAGIDEGIDSSVGIVEQRRSEADRLAREVAQAREVLADAAQASADGTSRCDAVRTALESVRERATRSELAAAEHRMRREHLELDVEERFALKLAEDVREDEPALEDAEEQALAERAKELKAALLRLGEVDTGAIEQLRELQEREEFLRAQREDLERSIADLERTIQKLNRISRTRFAETFAAVNERFQQIAPRLLRGGEARLVLTDEHNLLESGVEIFVRPPGKRLDSVTLLSGGEKALVAVSLIFSLFLINPTPFCFLDEVDAPLDDANIGRFSGLVREMSQHSQFIVITHNKRTMEAAHALYGVTMEEPGISKIISVAPMNANA